MQCKDIPDRPILEFLESLNGKWADWFQLGTHYCDRSVRYAMPLETPGKLVLAKMRMLIKRGLVDGCPCGCRGDFELTDKGKEYLRRVRGEV